MNNTKHSQLTTPNNQTDLSLFEDDYLSTHPSHEDLRKELLATQLSAEVLAEAQNLTPHEKRQVHRLLTAHDENQIHGIMVDTKRASQPHGDSENTMRDTAPIPREVPAPIGPVDQAYSDAMLAAKPGYIDIDAIGRGIFSGLIDTKRMESDAPYDPAAAERSVQARLAEHDGSAHEGFDDIVSGAEYERQAMPIPASPEVRRYADEKSGGQTTGAPDRFGEMAATGTIATLERATAEAARERNLLERWSVNIGTERRKFIGAESGTVVLPQEYQ